MVAASTAAVRRMKVSGFSAWAEKREMRRMRSTSSKTSIQTIVSASGRMSLRFSTREAMAIAELLMKKAEARMKDSRGRNPRRRAAAKPMRRFTERSITPERRITRPCSRRDFGRISRPT